MAQTGNMLMVDKLDQMKQERIQSYQNQYRTQENADNQAFTAGQNTLDREQRSSEFAATTEDAVVGRSLEGRRIDLEGDRVELEGQRVGMEGERIGIDKGRLNMAAAQIEQQLEIGNFTLDEARRLEGLYSTIASPDASEEDVSSAIATMQNLRNTDPEKYSAITMYGEENMSGVQTRTSGVLSSRTGRVTPVSSGAVMESMPDAAQNNGRTIRDKDTGEILTSNGTNWVPAS